MQPPPITTNSPEIWPLILRDIRLGRLIDPGYESLRLALCASCEARDAFGRAKYGAPLQRDNGRAPIEDALDEALDLMAYTRQHFEQRKTRRSWELHLGACAIAILVLAEREGV